MQTWQAFCADQDILLIEDCAQAHLAVCDGGAAGSFGAAGAFSFYPTKNLGAVGDAGMVVTSDRNIAQISGRLRNYGQNKRYDHSELGLNSRLDELQAAMLTERLKWLPGFTRRRTEIAGKYRSGLKNERIRLLDAPETDTSHVYHLFVIKCDRREALQDHLSAHDVQSLVHYPIPVHQQTSCPDISRDPEGLPNSEKFASTCLSLPCHPQLSDDEVDKVIRVVNAFQGC
jgi:dTDP-4-amino-4,6-dideoxygalactose transaminase